MRSHLQGKQLISGHKKPLQEDLVNGIVGLLQKNSMIAIIRDHSKEGIG